IVSATTRVASRALPPATREVTSRYRLPFVRPTEPTAGSTTPTESGESGRRSCSVTAPSFSWTRTAKGRASWGVRRARGHDRDVRSRRQRGSDYTQRTMVPRLGDLTHLRGDRRHGPTSLAP